uniref:Uncharacterized protein n=1 Tax=Amphimedon queenslandica TaxID=400682 RepID=A0A1X7UXU3_AMPQE
MATTDENVEPTVQLTPNKKRSEDEEKDIVSVSIQYPSGIKSFKVASPFSRKKKTGNSCTHLSNSKELPDSYTDDRDFEINNNSGSCKGVLASDHSCMDEAHDDVIENEKDVQIAKAAKRLNATLDYMKKLKLSISLVLCLVF